VRVNSQSIKNARIKIYNQDNGIVQNFGQAVLVDRSNFIWIGTQAGLNKFNGYNFDLYTNDKKNKNSLGFDDITSLFEDKENRIWVGTSNGLNTIDKVKNKISRKQLLLDSTYENVTTGILSINQNLNGRIMLGGYDGKFFIGESNSSEFKNINTDIKEAIFSIVNDKQNNSWLGTDGNGLYILRNNSVRPEKVSVKSNETEITNITSLCFDKNENLLIGTRKNGAFILNTKNLQLEKIPSLENFKIKCIFKDSKNRIWVGTEDMGLFYKENHKQEFLLFEESIFKRSNNLYNKVTSITEDLQGNIWITCTGGGLVQINFQLYPFNILFKTSTEYEIVDNTFVASIFMNEKNEYWCGLTGGDLKTNVNTHKDFNKNFKALGAYAYCIFEKGDLVYFGTQLGVFKGNKKTSKFEKINFQKSDKNQKAVIRINEFDDKIIFINYGGSLSYIDLKTNEEHSFENNKTLANLILFSFNCITPLGDKYYAAGSSNKGLIILYFGGINGVVYFNPKKLTMNTKAPIVSLTNFKVLGSELKLDTNITFKKQIKLSYSQNIFSIDFVALDYSSPEKNQFAYKLEGFDNDWIYSGQRRFANYTNIDPGDYIFKVKASNNDGVWNEKGIELKISILPPFYKTKWFYSLCTILFFSLIYTFIKRREIQLKKENKLLESKVTERTKEIENINSILYKKNRDITDSINYAKRIQEAFLLPEFELKKLFKDAFIFFNPKDIVSGDFYWFTTDEYPNNEEGIEKLFLVAVADCTGHGVPGALMSMIGIDRLTDCSKKTSHPGKILKLLNQSIKDSLRQSTEYSDIENSDSETSRDGMDICLVQIAYLKNGQIRIRYSGANRPLWIISNSVREINEYKQNKSAVGGFTPFDYFFEEQELILEKGDKIYMFTDGYCDQFGGPEGKKFLTKRFRTFLSSISHLPMFQQSELLEKELIDWMGADEQVDDLLVLGFTV